MVAMMIIINGRQSHVLALLSSTHHDSIKRNEQKFLLGHLMIVSSQLTSHSERSRCTTLLREFLLPLALIR